MDNFKTNDLLFNPDNSEDLERLRQEHAEFQVHIKGLDPSMVLRYIIWAYDRQSPLRDDYPNIHQRKSQAAILAGFKIAKKNRFPERVEELLLGKIREGNIMVVKYILLRPDPDALSLELYYEMLVRQTVATIGQIADPKIYKDVLANTENLRKKIVELTQNVFGGDDLTAIKRELYGLIEAKRTAIRPEDIAERIEKGEEPIEEEIYGNYAPEPITLAKSAEQVYKAE